MIRSFEQSASVRRVITNGPGIMVVWENPSCMGSLEKENARLKRIVADLEFDKLILKESHDYLKRKA